MKVKIRKVEVDVVELVKAVEETLVINERLTNRDPFPGTSVTYICNALGLKEFDFWKIYMTNTLAFKDRIEVEEIGDNKLRVLFRTKTLKAIREKKAAEYEAMDY